MFSVLNFTRLALLCCIALLSACVDQSSASPKQFYTWEGLEPDRWSSIWLIKRHVDTSAEVSIVPVGARLRGAEAIATSDASVQRTHGKSNYENLLSAYKKDQDPILLKIGDIINELEISPWSKSTPLVAVVEREFRNLQYQHNRIDVPVACYSGFFDALYTVLETNADDLTAVAEALDPESICQASGKDLASTTNTTVLATVLEYSTAHVLNLINANRKVVFVDTRENEEFDERHIPGAVIIKLRDVSPAVAESLHDADLVIAYCIKDFRAYEVALALSKLGVKSVGIMNPFGLKGWLDAGLPVVDNNKDEAGALEKLKRRAEQGA